MFDWIQGPVLGIVGGVATAVVAGVTAYSQRNELSNKATTVLAAIVSTLGAIGVAIVCVDAFGAPVSPTLYVLAAAYCAVVFAASIGIDLGVLKLREWSAVRRAEKMHGNG